LFLSIQSMKTITKLKEEDGVSTGAITILGSGSIIQQLANMAFIDEYELLVVPIIILGNGKYLFKDKPEENIHSDLHYQ
jgi:dihydrofolate reductase